MVYENEDFLNNIASKASIIYKTKVLFSNCLEPIPQLARIRKVDLIVLGASPSHGVNANPADPIPSVLEMATCPVLIVPPGTVFKTPKQIAVAADLADELSNQFEFVKELAEQSKAELAFLHVMDENSTKMEEWVQQ